MTTDPTHASKVFGEFIEDLPSSQEYLILGFSPTSVPLKQRWRNNGLSADFLADYLTTFFPASEDELTALSRRDEIKGAVSYIANELLENAMKFSSDASQHPISIQLQLHPDKVIFVTTNSICPESVQPFQALIEKLITSDPDELYLNQLEQRDDDSSDTSSGLGFLTMMNDYLAKLGWKFETIKTEPDLITVTTMVQIGI
ncbi:MAG TPA: DUF6272 family protein [Crinalium sp.]|jgi:hypothetical protein